MIELTDQKRYQLEQENIVNLILDANRNGHDIDGAYLANMLNLDPQVIDRLLTTLQNDNIIK